MKASLLRALIIVALFILGPASLALAHGGATIVVEPTLAPAGGQITITGSEMEPGEEWSLTLEGISSSIPLGQASVTGEGEEGGFTVTLTLPADIKPGSYIVQAVTPEGESASAEITITATSEAASAEPAMVREATGEEHLLDRSKPLGLTIGVGIVIALSAATGIVLIRNRG